MPDPTFFLTDSADAPLVMGATYEVVQRRTHLGFQGKLCWTSPSEVGGDVLVDLTNGSETVRVYARQVLRIPDAEKATTEVYVVLSFTPDGRIDLEVLDAPPQWDTESQGQSVLVANINGGDSAPYKKRPAEPLTSDLTAENGKWLTASELRAHLAQFPDDTPVTATDNSAGWMNLIGATDPNETDEPSIVLITRDDFDTRQW
jgi:hypothetical protein